MSNIFALFEWLPDDLRGLFVGAVAVILLVALFKLVVAIVKLIIDLIPGW